MKAVVSTITRFTAFAHTIPQIPLIEALTWQISHFARHFYVVKTHHNDQWNLIDEKLGFNNTKECHINNNKTEKNFPSNNPHKWKEGGSNIVATQVVKTSRARRLPDACETKTPAISAKAPLTRLFVALRLL
jgi:hypothetical protein